MTILAFNVTGNAVIDTELGTIDLHLKTGDVPIPPVEPPANHDGQDELDIQSVIITADAPDVRGWPIGSKLLTIALNRGADMGVDFTKRWTNGPWPFILNSEGGEIEYTLWLLSQCGNPSGPWYAAGGINCISRGEFDNYVPTGPVLDNNQIAKNWFYYAPAPLGGYQPAIGEPVGWMLTSGDQRRGDIHAITERTNIIVTPFSAGVYSR